MCFPVAYSYKVAAYEAPYCLYVCTWYVCLILYMQEGLDPHITTCKLKTHICTIVLHMQRRPATAVVQEVCAQLHTPDIVVGSHKRHAQSNFVSQRAPRHALCSKQTQPNTHIYMHTHILPHSINLDPLSNHTITTQLLDLVVGRTQNLSKDLIGVLTQQRRRTPDPRGRVGVLDRSIHHFDGPARGVIDLGHHVPCQHYEQPLLAQRKYGATSTP